MRRLIIQFPVATFFVVAYAVTLTSALLTRLMIEGIVPRVSFVPAVATFGPSIAGLLIAIYLYGLTGIRHFISHLNPVRAGLRWPIFCLLLPALLMGFGVMLYMALLSDSSVNSLTLRWFTWPNFIAGVVSHTFLQSGMGEELGWRGFALPHLQRHCSALKSSLVIGIVWAFWHLPHHFLLGTSPGTVPEVATYVLSITTMSIVFTVVYNSTKGSLLAVMLLHGTNNACWSYLHELLPGLEMGGVTENMIVGGMWIVVAVVCVFIFGPEHLAGQVRQMPDIYSENTTEAMN